MSINVIADWPDDFDKEVLDEDLDDDLDDDFDERDDDPEDGPTGLVIEFAVDAGTARLAYAYTKGLWWMGIPELCLSPPRSYVAADGMDWSRLGAFLGAGLIYLGQALIAVDHFEIPPYEGEFEGQMLRIWLRGQEPPDGPLAIALGSEVDTILRVDCSLWSVEPPRPR